MKLTEEQQRAVRANRGFLHVEGGDSQYVVMSMAVFREMMGVGTDEELAESLRAIDRGLADVDAGRTRPYRDVLKELDSHG
jgi:predicted transcriptional regulator